MEAHVAVAHLALNLRTGHQSSHRVHHHHVQRAGAHQSLSDLQRLLAGVRLGDEHLVNVHPQSPGIGGVQSVFRIHKGHLAAGLLGLGNDMEGQGGLTGGLGAVDLNDPPLGDAADAQRQVQGQRTGGDDLHVQVGLVPQAHNGALAVHLLDVLHGGLNGFLLVAGHGCGLCQLFVFFGHGVLLLMVKILRFVTKLYVEPGPVGKQDAGLRPDAQKARILVLQVHGPAALSGASRMRRGG